MSRRAIFFDRDGTLCAEVGYVNHPSRLALLPRTAEAIRRVNDLGWAAVLATNQAGAARGYFPPHVLTDTHRRLVGLLAAEGARLDGIYACTHHPELGPPGLRRRCTCRKPRPGMLRRAERELGLDLPRSWVVGDRWLDVQLAAAVGARGGLLVRTGYGEVEEGQAPPGVTPAAIVSNVLEAASWIIRADRGGATSG